MKILIDLSHFEIQLDASWLALMSVFCLLADLETFLLGKSLVSLSHSAINVP